MLSLCFRSFVIGLAFNNNFVLPYPLPEHLANQGLRMRAATQADLESTTTLIREAYQHWVAVGVPVSPAFQKVETTRRHLLAGGFVVENAQKEIVATFTLEESFMKSSASQWIVDFSNPRDTVTFAQIPFQERISNRKKFLVFKKLAVHPSLGRQGLGRALFDIAIKFGRQKGYQGLMLETVREADWLHEWYLNLGLKEVGSKIYPGSQFETILMVKKF